MSRARATGAMLGDAEVMPEVGCMPRGQRISPWSDGRPADGADRERNLGFAFVRFCPFLLVEMEVAPCP